jgi:hypothetical protein
MSKCTVAAALLICGCGTLKGSSTTRGAQLETIHVRDDVTDVPTLVIEDRVATVSVARHRCAISSVEYAQAETQVWAHPPRGTVISRLVLAAVGGGLMWGSRQIDLGGAEDGILVGGLTLLGIGVGTALYNVVAKEEIDVRSRPLATRDKEQTEECSDSTFIQAERLAWTIATSGFRHTGHTGTDGALFLRDALVDTLELAPPATTATALLGERIAFEITLGAAPPVRHELVTEDISTAWWTRWEPVFAQTLSSEQRLRWDGCRSALAGRAAVACLLTPDRHPARVTEHAGALERSEGGDYAAVIEVAGRAGDTLSFRLLLPSADADWLILVTDLATGAVLAEKFSATSLRHDVSVVLPRDPLCQRS